MILEQIKEVNEKSIYRVDDNETGREGTTFEAINDAEAKRSFVKSLTGIHEEFKDKLELKRIVTRQKNGTYEPNYQIIMTGKEVENKQTLYSEQEVKELIKQAKEEWETKNQKQKTIKFSLFNLWRK